MIWSSQSAHRCNASRIGSRVGSAVVDPSDPGIVARDVVENGLDDVGLDAKLGHAGGAGSAEVVETPRREAEALVKWLLSAVPIVEATLPEDEVGGVATGMPLQDSEGLARERQLVQATILSAGGRKHDQLPPKIDLGPSQLADLVSALAGEQEQTDDIAEAVMPRLCQSRRNSSGVSTRSRLPPSSALAVPSDGVGVEQSLTDAPTEKTT